MGHVTSPKSDFRSTIFACENPPAPAANEVSEDVGQLRWSDKSASDLSDIVPAGRKANFFRGCSASEVSVAKETLDTHLDVRVSFALRDSIIHRAHVLGVKPSAWCRAALLDALDSRRDEIEKIERIRRTTQSKPNQIDAKKVETLRRIGTTFEGLRRDIARSEKDGTATQIFVDDALLNEAFVLMRELRLELGDRTRT